MTTKERIILIELLEKTVVRVKAQKKNLDRYICKSFVKEHCKMVEANYDDYYGDAGYKMMKEEYPKMAKWIKRIGRIYNYDYRYPSAWRYRGEEVTVEYKVAELEEFIRELKRKRDNKAIH